METILYIALVSIASLLVLVAFLVLGLPAAYYCYVAVQSGAEAGLDYVGGSFERIRKAERRRRLMAEIRRRTERNPSFVDFEVVEKGKVLERLPHLHKHVTDRAVLCLEAARMAAGGLGVRHFSQVAGYPIIQQLQAQVVQTLEIGRDELRSSPTLMSNLDTTKMYIAYDCMVPVCKGCPYMNHSVADAPRLCPTVQALGYQPERSRPQGEAA